MAGLSRQDEPGSPVGGPEGVPALVRAAAEGDEGAWRSLVGLYARRVFALARSRLRDADLAEDVTQGVFMKVAEQLGREADDEGYQEQWRFEAWLFRIAMNRIRDEARRGSRRRRHEEAFVPLALRGDEDGEDDDRPDLATLAKLHEVLGRLGDADREVVSLRHHAGLGFKEIASLLEEPLGTVLARHHRALRKLRRWLEESAEDDGDST